MTLDAQLGHGDNLEAAFEILLVDHGDEHVATIATFDVI
jgi:hypothetical protein